MATLSIKITDREIAEIENKVKEGLAMNSSDYVRQAIRDRLSTDNKKIIQEA